MREILFRGKTEYGSWIIGDLLQYANTAQIWTQEEHGKCNYIVDPATVGQFTGLKDKNGVKIFEGDVIRIKIEGESSFTFNYLRKVVFVNGIFGIGKQKDEESISPFPIYSMDMFKVIGNIHDNFELLEEESE